MTEIKAKNAREALVTAALSVMMWGYERTPRGMHTLDLPAVTLRVEDPADWHCAGIGANWSARVVAVEALQLVGGFSDPQLVGKYAPTLMAFANERNEFDGAYGPRVGQQIGAVVEKLQQDPDTRQAVLTIYNQRDALREKSKDYPCTLSIGFDIQGGKLRCHVTMRSNDVDWGLKHDMGQFMLLQCTLANVLGLEVGEYTHHAYSLHIYERAFDWAEKLIEENISNEKAYAQHPSIPRGGFSGRDVGDMRWRAEAISRFAIAPEKENEVEKWAREVLHGRG